MNHQDYLSQIILCYPLGSSNISRIMCTLPPTLFLLEGGGGEALILLPNFQKGGGALDSISIFTRSCWVKGGNLFSGEVVVFT